MPIVTAKVASAVELYNTSRFACVVVLKCFLVWTAKIYFNVTNRVLIELDLSSPGKSPNGPSCLTVSLLPNTVLETYLFAFPYYVSFFSPKLTTLLFISFSDSTSFLLIELRQHSLGLTLTVFPPHPSSPLTGGTSSCWAVAKERVKVVPKLDAKTAHLSSSCSLCPFRTI